MPDVATTISLIIAAAAFLLSLYLFVTGRLANRIASLEARWEDVPGGLSRIVLVNRGPSRARLVTLRLTDRDGKEARVSLVEDYALPIPELNANQDFHVAIAVALGADLACADLTWKDGRRGTQSSKVWLTRRHPT